MGALVSTVGVVETRLEPQICPVCVKKDTLNINAKKNNNFALAA